MAHAETRRLPHLAASVAALLAFLPAVGAGASLAADEPTGLARAALSEDGACTKCHGASWPKPILSIYQTRHGARADSRTPGCQSCHGPSDAHRENPGDKVDVVFGAKSKNISTADARNAACLSCHETRVLSRTDWVGSQHQTRGVTCTSCHEIHTPNQRVLDKATQSEVCFACHKEQRAQTHRISTHPLRAGRMACSDCHNPHGSTGPKLLVKETVNDTCYTCHAEKRGPFLWEHAPASDDCTNCHTPHGSNNTPLLKVRAPWLCQQCHAPSGHPTNAYSAANLPGGEVAISGTTLAGGVASGAPENPAPQLLLRGCNNCHVQVHGSNHPGGALLLR